MMTNTAAEVAEFEHWWKETLGSKTPHYKYLARKAWFDSRAVMMGTKRLMYDAVFDHVSTVFVGDEPDKEEQADEH